MKIEVGKFYRGKVNNCLIQIIATKEEQTINGPVVIAMYVDTKTNKVDSAPLARLERSAFELGIVKTVCCNNEYFINYHTGDTAARTHARHLHKISNLYAFRIVRLDTDGRERRQHDN